MLLSIVPLAIVNVLSDDTENNLSTVPVPMRSQYKHEMKSDGSMKLGLISSVQVLGHFSGLLCPPALVVDAANQAAKKAASFIYNSMNEKGESFTSIHANGNTKAGRLILVTSYVLPLFNLLYILLMSKERLLSHANNLLLVFFLFAYL
jgi:hypothetical protein